MKKTIIWIIKLIFSPVIGIIYGLLLLFNKKYYTFNKVVDYYDNLYCFVVGKRHKIDYLPNIIITFFAFWFGGLKKSSREYLRDELNTETNDQFREFLYWTVGNHGVIFYSYRIYELERQIKTFKEIDPNTKIRMEDKTTIVTAGNIVKHLEDRFQDYALARRRAKTYLTNKYYFGCKGAFDKMEAEAKRMHLAKWKPKQKDSQNSHLV